MTLLEYFMKKSNGQCKQMEREYFSSIADFYDAEEFANKNLGKKLKNCKYEEVFKAFLEYCKECAEIEENFLCEQWREEDHYLNVREQLSYINNIKTLDLIYDPVTYEKIDPNEDFEDYFNDIY